MSQAGPPAETGKSGSAFKSVAVIGLAVVALLSLAFAGYTALNPHTVTVTQQQLLTNTQSITSVQTQTVTYASTWTSVQTVTNTLPASGYGNGYGACSYYGCYQAPYYPGYYPGSYYGNYWYYPGYYGYGSAPPCQYGSSNNVTCSGYLNEASNGCTLLVVPTTNNPYPSYATTYVYEYYTLHNLPANTPSNGAWITVNGQLYQGYNTASNGASCPNNYIIVSSVT